LSVVGSLAAMIAQVDIRKKVTELITAGFILSMFNFSAWKTDINIDRHDSNGIKRKTIHDETKGLLPIYLIVL
jgi:hypothetical protein